MVLLFEFYSHSPMGVLPIERPSVIFSVRWISHREHQQKPSAPGIWRLITYFTNSYISYITNKLYPPKKLIRSILIVVSYTYYITSKLISPPSELQPEVPCIQQSLVPPASAYPSGRGSSPPQLLAAAVRPPKKPRCWDNSAKLWTVMSLMGY